MSTDTTNPGITADPATGPVLQLPAVTDDLYVIHYSSELRERSPTQTPPVSAIVVQHVVSGAQATFATFTLAERDRLPPADLPARFEALERQMLGDFFDFVADHPTAVWVHWGMRGAGFGFDVLAQRARIGGLVPMDIPTGRRFDLSNYLKQRFGDGYVPHPRLWNAIRRNLGAVPWLLDEEATAAAWQRGDFGAVLWSLGAKVGAIDRLLDRVRRGEFLTGTGDPSHPLDQVVAVYHHLFQQTAALLYRQEDEVGETPNPPAPGLRRLRAAIGVLAQSNLSDRQWTILDELFRRKAFDRESPLPTAQLAVGVDGPSAVAGSFKRPVARLRTLGLIDTMPGCQGGVWLTAAGRSLAERRTSA